MNRLQRLNQGKIPCLETGIEVRKSVCALCSPNTQCGLDCYVKDGRIIKVEGSRENPHSAGTLCVKGAAQRQWVYHEERLRTPMKRVGPRGSGEMAPISWTEALDTITENLQRLKAESGPESVVFYCGYPQQMRPFLRRLISLYGSPNYCSESSVCATAMGMAWRLNYGQPAVPDLTRTKTLLVWTRNPFHSHTPSARGLMDARDRGVKFIVVDPRRSPIAAIADLHLQIRPGADGALAHAMANVIISEGLYDREFVSQWTIGFDEYRAYVASFPLDRAEEITGIPAALIHEAAVLYAASKPAAMLPSSDVLVHHTNGIQNQRAALALVGLTGNFDVPGGNLAQPLSWLYVAGAGFVTRQQEFELPLSFEDLPPRIGADRFPVWMEMTDQGQALDMVRHIVTGRPYPLRGLLGFGMNHRMFPDSGAWSEAFARLEFICMVDLFATDTAKYADIVLPACTSVERSGFRAYSQKYALYTQPVIEPLGESRSDTDIIFGLARKLGLPFQRYDDSHTEELGGFLSNGAPDFTAAADAAMDWMLAPSGLTVGELKKHPGGMPVPSPLPEAFKKYEKYGFPTPSGKMEFVSSLLEKYSDREGIEGLPIYREPGLSPLSTPDIAVDYPLILNTGSRLPMFIHSRFFQVPWARSLRPQATADIHPTDAFKLGIVQGDQIEISTPRGFIRVQANVSELAHVGVVHMLYGYQEADVNALLPGDYVDPISGFPGFKASLCAVKKVASSSPGKGNPLELFGERPPQPDR